MSDIYFSNYQLEKDCDYFLFIGSIKNYGLNIFFKEALSRIYHRKFNFIAIIQDVFKRYHVSNLIVINPMVDAFSRQHGGKGSCRILSREFMSCVSDNHHIQRLVQKLLKRQKKLYIYMYQSMPEMTLDRIPGVYIIGPDSKISDRLNSKIYQYVNCKDFLPIPEFCACKGLDDVLYKAHKRWPVWSEGIFVSKEYNVGGLQSIVAHTPGEITDKFNVQEQNYIIVRYIPHIHDPTVLGVVANEKDVYIAGIADQFIERHTRFAGSIFPTELEKKHCLQLKKYTQRIGKWLASEGFRGIFGCDYLIDAAGRIYFLEVNARKQGTTMEFACTLENTLPPGSPTLPELEYYAVRWNRFPENTVEMEKNLKNIHWGTYNCKTEGLVRTRSNIEQHMDERRAFSNLANNKIDKNVMILDYIGENIIVSEKSFLARIISLGHNRKDILRGIDGAKKKAASAIV